MTGVELIAKERREQIEKHGRLVIKDVSTNSNGELLTAAIKMTGKIGGIPWPEHWKKDICEKMDKKSPEEKLIIAGAFIAAELDRLIRIDDAIFGKKNETQGQLDEFTEACRPLIRYMAEKHHPHMSALVTDSNATLMEGKKAIEVRDYIKD
jgi:hypothetical protein